MTEPFAQWRGTDLVIKEWSQMDPTLKAGFTTRNGGYSASPFNTFNLGLHVADNHKKVLANRQVLSEALNFPLESWVSGEQTHQTNVHIVTEKDIGKGSTAYETSLRAVDGLITNRQGVLCTAFFADCVPIYFFAPSSGYIGIAHAGWKGTVNRIGEKMIQAFQKVGVNPSELKVAIGPCISGAVYEVDEKVIRHIPEEFVKKTVESTDTNRFLLDLKQLNAEILLQQGVLHRNIEMTHYCTYSDETLFFSHRRDHGETGRMLGYIGYER